MFYPPSGSLFPIRLSFARRFTACLLAVLFLSVTLSSVCLAQAVEIVPGEYLVKLRSAEVKKVAAAVQQSLMAQGVPARAARLGSAKVRRGMLSAMGFRVKKSLPLIGAHVVSAGADADDSGVSALIDKNANLIEYIEPNYIVRALGIPNDTEFAKLWGMHNANNVDIDAPEAWEAFSGAEAAVVAVLDTGVDYTHPDLKANMWVNPDPANDGNTIPNDVHGFNVRSAPAAGDTKGMTYGPPGAPYDYGFGSHGTHVSGTIAAVANNALGVAGIGGPAGRVKIMAIRFMDDLGRGRMEQAVAGFDYVVNMRKRGVNVRVITASWGAGAYSQALLDAIKRAESAGIIFAAAAGNGNKDGIGQYNCSPTESPCSGVLLFPASYQVASIISVAAVDRAGALAVFSNYGAKTVHLAAPGVDILSTIAAYPKGDYYTSGKYYSYKGTSMATPHVAGAAALLASQNPALSAVQIKNILLQSVKPLASLNGRVSSGGMLNLSAALKAAAPASYSISGYVKVGAAALAGVTVSGPGGTRTTDANGFYRFAQLAAGSPYAISAARPGYSFTLPANRSGTLSGDVTVNIAAERVPYELKARVPLEVGAPLGGVTISDAKLGTRVSDPQGAFSFSPVYYGASYSLNAVLSGYTITRPARFKKIMVVGGGPAGLEAAKEASRRGHEVALYERESSLGGQVNLLARLPNREEFSDVIRNQTMEMERYPVKILLDTEVTPDLVEKEKPDAVVVAAGSQAGPCYLPGAGLPHVFTFYQALAGCEIPGDRVLVVDDTGFHQGAGTAEYLSRLGKKVTLLTPGLYPGQDLMPTMDLPLWYRRALDQGIEMVTSSIVKSIDQNSVTVFNHYTGQEAVLAGITAVVLVGQPRAREEIYHQLKGKVPEIYRVGDCLAPRRVEHAIYDGFKVGRSI